MNKIRIGTTLPVFGPIVDEVPLRDAARRAEDAGFDSVWASDHVVMIRGATSSYPYSRDGEVTWDPTQSRFDALVSMAIAVAVTRRVEVGVAVLIAALRNPLVLAKQLATLDVVSGGRVIAGVGAGWLAEEFKALEVPFDSRGTRLNEWIDIVRDCWTGTPRAHSYQHYEIPDGVLCYPTPVRSIPILVGGMSPAALHRAGQRGDGWIAFQRADSIDLATLAAGIEAIRTQARVAGRVASRAVVRLAGPVELVARAVPNLASIGITEVIVEVDWQSDSGPQDAVKSLRAAQV